VALPTSRFSVTMDFNKLAQSPLDGLDKIQLRIQAIEKSLVSIDNSLKQLAPVIALLKRFKLL
jgi:hypothetical protein